MSHLQHAQIEKLRAELERERTELANRLQGNDKFGMDEPMGVELGELSLVDNHPGDIGSEMFERGKDLALTELWEHQLEKAEAALARIDAGTYGHCLRCGEPIPLARLQALPSAETCVRHVQDDETSQRRPREEQFLRPAMRSDLDHSDTTQFDGEDAWQIVERWGTSNTPAMQEGRDHADYNDMEIESDELDGYVEPYESFLATDMYGNNVTFVRNDAYQKYWERGEGFGLLEPGETYDMQEQDEESGAY